MAIAVPDLASLILAPTASAGAYRPRRPQDTLLHRVVREHFRTFLAHTDRIYARPLPPYVVLEFEKYLACGDLTRGFVRCVCEACGLERVVPFSCKTRGLCPSCAGRRMADSAARLVDSVLPDVPIRQWVLTLPLEPTSFCTRFVPRDDPLPVAPAVRPLVARRAVRAAGQPAAHLL
jgi:hypothetical protein